MSRVARPSVRRRWGSVVGVAGLGVLIAVFHGRSLDADLFMDDYAHFRQLAESGWSIGELTRACRLELIGGILDSWALPDVTLRFFRPVSFGLMKLTYTLGGWRPGVMHAASLLWHLAASGLLMLLLRRVSASAAVAWIVAALFAIHPGHVATVQWIAAQSELMVTTLLLAATLCHARWRGRGLGAVAHPGLVWPMLSVAFFVLALGCRENAIMFPVIVAAMEVGRASRSKLSGKIAAYWVVLLLAVVGYLAARWHYLQGAALPPRPYVVPPTAPDFLPHVFNKFCYYLLGEFLLVPCVPVGGLDYMTARPWLLYPPAVLLIVILLAVAWRHRRGPGLLGPVWLIALMLPVLPAFESQHHLYLPGVGWALACGVLLQAALYGKSEVRRAKSESARPEPAEPSQGSAEPVHFALRSSTLALRRARRGIVGVALILTAAMFGTLTYFYGLALDTAERVEDRLVDEVVSAPRPLRDGDTMYFVNLPIVGHYVRLAVERETGLRGLRAVALTWSPRVLGVVAPAELEWTGPAKLEARIVDDRWFAGPFGRTVAQVTGRDRPIDFDRPLHKDGVTIELLSADEAGIAGLRFVFDQPPGLGGAHVFFGSMQRWAYQSLPAGGP